MEERSAERLKRLEHSHVQLMTNHDVFVREHMKRVEEQDREWQRQLERWPKSDEQREQDRRETRSRGEEIDRRISDLVSGIGEFMRRGRDAA